MAIRAAVLEQAMICHGKPAAILHYHGSQFYSNEKLGMERGTSMFEKTLAELGMRQILAGIGPPQTNGKLERLHGEIQRKLRFFEDTTRPLGTGAPIDVVKIEQNPRPVHVVVQPR